MDIGTMFLYAALFLGFYVLLAAARLLAGPTLPDRVVALDTINTLIVASMIVLGVVFEQVIYVDIAIVYALLSFITTLFIAKYMESKVPEREVEV